MSRGASPALAGGLRMAEPTHATIAGIEPGLSMWRQLEESAALSIHAQGACLRERAWPTDCGRWAGNTMLHARRITMRMDYDASYGEGPEYTRAIDWRGVGRPRASG